MTRILKRDKPAHQYVSPQDDGDSQTPPPLLHNKWSIEFKWKCFGLLRGQMIWYVRLLRRFKPTPGGRHFGFSGTERSHRNLTWNTSFLILQPELPARILTTFSCPVNQRQVFHTNKRVLKTHFTNCSLLLYEQLNTSSSEVPLQSQ